MGGEALCPIVVFVVFVEHRSFLRATMVYAYELLENPRELLEKPRELLEKPIIYATR